MASKTRSRRDSESYISSFIHWLQLKKYQYEVTFSLYMLTPTEKVIFNSVLFILASMLITAATMYLPNHIVTIYTRVWYYAHGENITDSAGVVMASSAAQALPRAASATADAVRRKLGEL